MYNLDRKKKTGNFTELNNRNPLGSDENDGAFWMGLNDFINNYSSISIVSVFESPTWKKITVTGSWRGSNAAGCSNHPENFKNNPQFLLVVPRNTPAVINMTQTDKRGQGGKDLFAVGWSFFNNAGKKFSSDRIPRPAYKSGSYSFSRDMFIEVPELKSNNEGYTVVCATFDPGEETDFSLTIISKEEVFVQLF